MIDFCAEHNIVSDVEMVPIQSVNQAYERLLKNDVRYRFVIDMASLKGSQLGSVSHQFQASTRGRGAACHADSVHNSARPWASSRDGTPTERSAAT